MMRSVSCAIACVWLVSAAPAWAQSRAPASIEAVYSDQQLNQFVLDVEAALSRAQARHGVIPRAAARDITRRADIRYVPAEELEEEYERVRHRMVALLNVWRRSLSEEAGEYVHYGATTVDIYDTAHMIQVRRSILLMIEDLRAIELQLIELAREHRDTPMIGRTLGQHALPITFGKVVSVWISENRRHIERLTQLLARVERSAIMKGAVGSYVGLGPQAMNIERSFAEELGFQDPYVGDWHGSRDVFAEYGAVLALMSRSFERLGQEIFLLQTTDIGEVSERVSASTVGSSTMPHKTNPSLSEALIHRARIISRLAEVMQDDMVNFFERDNTSRPNGILGEMSIETERMLSEASRLIERIEVNTEVMRANLGRTDGMIMSQRLVFALAPAMGRVEAEERVREAAEAAFNGDIRFREALLAEPRIAAILTPEQLDDLLDPTTYLGMAPEQVDAIIDEAMAARAHDPTN